MFKSMGLKTKLLAAFLSVGVIPFAAISVVALWKSDSALSKQAYGQLQSMREVKKTQIERYFAERRGDMSVLVETVGTLRAEAFAKLTAVRDIKKDQIDRYFAGIETQLGILAADPYMHSATLGMDSAFQEGGVGSPAWKSAAARYNSRLTAILAENGWYDLFLINGSGDIVYTCARESDLGMNLAHSDLKTSSLGTAYAAATADTGDNAAFGDFRPYAPSKGEPASFFVRRMADGSGRFRGYIAVQIPLEQVNAIMGQRNGMGETGETYLVGEDMLMRSDSFLDPKHHTVVASFTDPTNGRVDTDGSRAALKGETGAAVIVDYNGNPVLSAYSPVTIGLSTWALLAEIDVAEAFCPKDESGSYFFAEYVEMYGYYDLFLTNPNGYVFFTAARESDYQTNMLNGPYANSGLGKLTRRVLETKEYAVQDFEPYAPSAGEPAAFIAQPVVNGGEVELVVALQLSLGSINAIMQQRDGMGETGETYLVGQDKLMRSDSYLDSTHHTVKASFADPAKGGCDTEAVRKALAGESGEKIIIDYNGNPVLSAYAPIRIGNLTWALLAEIDEAEAFAAVNSITWLMVSIAAVGLATIVAVALLITRSITQPINVAIDGLSRGAEQVTAASSQVSSSGQQIAEGASEAASSLEETSASLEEMASMTNQNAGNAQTADTMMTETTNAVGKGSVAVNEMAQAMTEISAASEKTSHIIKTIEEIAFQTNLLALNAAVEAARAGDAGKGFAVVAEEVRNLAQRASGAAKDTSDLIQGTVDRVHKGTGIIGGLKDTFAGIQDSAGKVAALVAEINSASREQSMGISQVNTAVAQMDQVTQSNAANAEESASAAEELSAQASELLQIVGDLQAMVGGSDKNNMSDGHAARSRSTSDVRRSDSARKPKTVPHVNAKRALNAHTRKKGAADPTEIFPLDDGENTREF